MALLKPISKRRVGGLLALIAIVAGVSLFAQAMSQPQWFRPEVNDRYGGLACGYSMGPSTLLPHERFPSTDAFWKNEPRRIMTTVVTEEDWERTDPTYDGYLKNDPGQDYVELTSGERVVLRGIQIAYFIGPEELAVKRYGPDGSTIESEEVIARNAFPRQFQPGHSEVSLRFELPPGIASIRTRTAIEPKTDSYYILTEDRSPEDPTQLTLRITGYCWRPAPLTYSFVMAHGKAQVTELEVKPKARADFERISLIILESQPGRYDLDPTSRSYDGKFNWLPHAREGQSVWYVASPKAHRDTLQMIWLDENGRAVEGAEFVDVPRRDALGYGVYLAPEANPPAKLRLSYSPLHDSIGFTTPQLVGMPAANHELANLFDLVIPYLEVRDWEQLLEAVTDTTSLIDYLEVEEAFPDGYFPRSFTNVTPRELLMELQENLRTANGNRPHLLVDLESDCIREPIPLWERLEEWWANNF